MLVNIQINMIHLIFFAVVPGTKVIREKGPQGIWTTSLGFEGVHMDSSNALVSSSHEPGTKASWTRPSANMGTAWYQSTAGGQWYIIGISQVFMFLNAHVRLCVVMSTRTVSMWCSVILWFVMLEMLCYYVMLWYRKNRDLLGPFV